MAEVDTVDAALEALLIMADEPMPVATLAGAVRESEPAVEERLRGLAARYDHDGHGFELRRVGGGWRYYTRAEHAELISTWVLQGTSARLSRAALETLAVVAYLQPISRSRVSAIRGVNVDGVVRTLVARGLLTEAGHDETTGAQLLATTDLFLEKMGMASLSELPPLAPHLPEASALEAELAALVEREHADESTAQRPVGDNDGSPVEDRGPEEETK